MTYDGNVSIFTASFRSVCTVEAVDWEAVERHWSDLDVGLVPLLFQGFSAAETSSTRKGVAFHLTYDDVGRLMARSKGRCEVSGMRFSMEKIDGARKRPYLPSIDRIKAKEPNYPFDKVAAFR